jgi:hypothetical protein
MGQGNMIKDKKAFKNFEDDLARHSEKLPYHLAAKIFESLWQEGVMLGHLPLREPMEGIDVDIRVAKILNSCLKKPFPG